MLIASHYCANFRFPISEFLHNGKHPSHVHLLQTGFEACHQNGCVRNIRSGHLLATMSDILVSGTAWFRPYGDHTTPVPEPVSILQFLFKPCFVRVHKRRLQEEIFGGVY